VLGLTFKENVPRPAQYPGGGHRPPSCRTTASPSWFTIRWRTRPEAQKYYGIDLQDLASVQPADAVVLAVAHDAYTEMGVAGCCRLCRTDAPAMVLDLKGAYSPVAAKDAGAIYWRL
jgi:UDP-N-acetyl-D-galactosamine dehydrogenase